MRTCAFLVAVGALGSAGCGGAATAPATTTVLRPIVVERPASGDQVGRTFHVSGTASVYEATLVVQTVRNGKTVERRTVTASDGAPSRGTFDTTMRATPGRITVRVFSPSAVDGSPQHEVDVDVIVRP